MRNVNHRFNFLLGDINMIEADIVMGRVTNDENSDKIPIMAHPPNWKSDLSLEMFMRRVLEYNINNETNVKGVKLDFKSIEAFKGALPLLKSLWKLVRQTSITVWLNY